MGVVLGWAFSLPRWSFAFGLIEALERVCEAFFLFLGHAMCVCMIGL